MISTKSLMSELIFLEIFSLERLLWFFSSQLLFAGVLGSELLLLRFFFSSFLGVVLGQERSFSPGFSIRIQKRCKSMQIL